MLLIIVLLVIILPILEIGIFIEISEAIGLWPTLSITLATTISGYFCIKRQTGRIISTQRHKLSPAILSIREIYNGLGILTGGILLFIPGFLTDILGIGLTVPLIRGTIKALIIWRSEVKTKFIKNPKRTSMGFPLGKKEIDLIEGEYTVTEAADSCCNRDQNT